MTSLTFPALAATQATDVTALRRLTAALPTDPASIFTILLLVVSLALVIWFGRPHGGGGRKA